MGKRVKTLLTLLFIPLLMGGRSFTRLTVDNGLSNNTVSGICQDNLGRIWLATHGGVNRYNGSEVDYFSFDRDNENSLQSNFVSRIFADRQGDIWACTADGLALFDAGSETFMRVPTSGMSAIEEILQLSEDIYLLGTRNRSAYYNRNTGEVMPATLEGRDFAFYGSTQMGDTLVLGSAGKDLIFLRWSEPRGMERIRGDLPLGCRATSIEPDGGNGLWLGTNNGGLLHWKKGSGKAEPVRLSSLTTPRIESLARDGHGNLWIGTKEGIIVMDPSSGGEEHLVHDPMDETSISSDAVRVIYKDSRDNIWVGSSYGGVCCQRARQSSFHTVRTGPAANGLDGSIIRATAADTDGSIWIGTRYDGLSHYNPKDGSIVTYDDIGYTLSMLIPEGRTAYAGTYSKGIYALDKVSGQHTRISKDIDANAMAMARNGQIWVASLAGLFLLDPATHTQKCVLKRENGSLFRAISLMVDSQGRLWVGAKECLKLFHVGSDNKLTDISPEVFSNIVRVQNLYEDSHGNTWIGTSDGLLRYSGEELESVEESSGLRSAPIDGITEDEDGMYWVITDNGLCRYDPVSRKGRFYYTEDGLPGNQYNNGTICRCSDGTIYIGSAKGLSRFVPSEVRDNLAAVPPYISSVSVNSIDVLKDGIATLKRGQNSFRVHYACPDYASWGHNHFRYRLDGFDSDWNYTTFREARYTNIPKGRYRLRVAASNSDGIWASEEATVRIIIRPPFYRSTVFEILLMLLAAAALAYGVLQLVRRVRKQGESKLEKLRQQYEDNIRKTRLHSYVIDGVHLTPQDEDFLSSVLEHAENGAASSSYSVEDLAGEMCMSRSNLNIRLKAITGMTPIDLIKQMRIERACKLLREGEMPLKDIAFNAGFASLSYFGTAFKKATGMTPGEYSGRKGGN